MCEICFRGLAPQRSSFKSLEAATGHYDELVRRCQYPHLCETGVGIFVVCYVPAEMPGQLAGGPMQAGMH